VDKPLEEELTLELIPEGLYRSIAEAIGVSNFLIITEMLGGSTTYLPQKESILRPIRDRRILEEYNGYNQTELAKKYGVSERWVRRLKADNS
jgi:Mor family transcriptional regulator